MDARAQGLRVQRKHLAAFLLAASALSLGAVAGSVATQALETDVVITREHVVGIVPWDQQKLDAMKGRQAAAAHEAGLGIVPWDPQKLDAMEGFQASAGER